MPGFRLLLGGCAFGLALFLVVAPIPSDAACARLQLIGLARGVGLVAAWWVALEVAVALARHRRRV